MESAQLTSIDKPARSAEPTPDWQAFLPSAWRDMVIEPFDFRMHREYEMAAARSFGYDIDGVACYYAHSYALSQIHSDDDEDFYEVIAYGETVRAWRMRDDRWLIFRKVYSDNDNTPGRGFYSFSTQQPR